jgi:hypothetical protein
MKLALFDDTAFHRDHPKGTVSFNYLLMGDEPDWRTTATSSAARKRTSTCRGTATASNRSACPWWAT